MYADRRTPRVALGLLLALLIAVGCKKGAPEKTPPKPKAAPTAPAPEVTPPTPKVEVVDLAPIEGALGNPADTPAALEALKKLDEALATEGAVPEDQQARAKELRVAGAFAVLAQTALSGGDLKAVAPAVGLGEDAVDAASAFAQFAKNTDPASAAGKAAALLAWLEAKPEARGKTPLPMTNPWRALAGGDATTDVAVRTVAARRLSEALTATAGEREADRAVVLAMVLGRLLCAKCAALPLMPPPERAANLYTPDNIGYVCEKAQEQLGGKAPYAFPEALAGICQPSDYGLTTPADLGVLTAGNALVLRTLAMALAAARAPSDEGAPLAKVHETAAGPLRAALAKMTLPLALPWLPVPEAEREAQAARVLPPAHLNETPTLRPTAPLETVVVDEKGVSVALRPVVAVKGDRLVLEDRALGLAFPGKRVIAADAVAASDEKRDEAAKAARQKVADRDVITEVKEGLRDLGEHVDKLEARVFPGAAPERLNGHREAGQSTVTLAVDAAAPAWLLKRTLASLREAGYRHALVPKPSADDLAGERVLPIVYRTAEWLPEGVATRTHKRPILVHVTATEVQIFPPYRRTAKREKKDAAAPAIAWPKSAKTVLDGKKRLFAVTVPVPEAKEAVGPAVAQTVRKLAQANDAGNVVYVVAAKDAPAGRLLEVVDAVTTQPDAAPLAVNALEPGLLCEGVGCPTHVAVLFPDVKLPKMPTVKVAAPKAPQAPPGFCDKGNIKKVVGRRSGSFRFCYEQELQLHPDLAGRVTVRFTIGADGRVASAQIAKSTLRNRKVEQCIIKKFKGMRFDKPQGGVCVVNWPLKFTN